MEGEPAAAVAVLPPPGAAPAVPENGGLRWEGRGSPPSSKEVVAALLLRTACGEEETMDAPACTRSSEKRCNACRQPGTAIQRLERNRSDRFQPDTSQGAESAALLPCPSACSCGTAVAAAGAGAAIV